MKTANTYKNWEKIGEPFEKEGKLYTKVKTKCDRCSNGIYAVGVENGQIKPHPAYNGICLKCHGAGYLTKEVRLYTDKEYDQMEKSRVKAANKREEERIAKMKAEFETKRAQWLEREGFNEDEVTYVYFESDSYARKEELKAAGFRFNQVLLWHAPSVPAGYESSVVRIGLDEVVELSAWGEGHYKMGSKDLVAAACRKQRTPVDSEWFMQPKDKFENLEVTITDIHTFSGAYGPTSIIKFEDSENHTLKWYTTTFVNHDKGDVVFLKGTVKEHINDKYEDEAKITLITRCKITSIEGE